MVTTLEQVHRRSAGHLPQRRGSTTVSIGHRVAVVVRVEEGPTVDTTITGADLALSTAMTVAPVAVVAEEPVTFTTTLNEMALQR